MVVVGEQCDGGGRCKGVFLPQDRALELLERGAGLDSECVDERVARVLVGLERLRLAAAAVQREHELAAQPLTERIGGDQGLELADELALAAELEVGVDSVFEHGGTELLEVADLLEREGVVLEVGERRATPQLEGLPEHRRPRLRRQLTGLRYQPLEAGKIELVRIDADGVSRWLRLQAVRAEHLAQA